MALITTKLELKEFLAISNQTEITSISPYIERAEREFIIPQIGQAMYDDVDDFYTTTGTPTADSALLKKVQAAIVNFAYYLYFDMLAVHVSEAGVQRIESTERKTAYQYQEVNLRNNLLTSGYEILGATLNYLEEYKTTYTTWASDTTSYERFKFLLIHTPALFQDIFDIKNSWATFFALRPIVKKIEDLFLEPVLGDVFLLELKNEIKTDVTTNITLIKLIRKAVVFFVVANAAQTKILQLGKDGTFELKKAGASIKQKNPSDKQKLAAFINEHHKTGNLYLKRLVEYLNNNASLTVYATYFASKLYQNPTSTAYNTQTWDNSLNNKSVIV